MDSISILAVLADRDPGQQWDTPQMQTISILAVLADRDNATYEKRVRQDIFQSSRSLRTATRGM